MQATSLTLSITQNNSECKIKIFLYLGLHLTSIAQLLAHKSEA
jgi:hypothetical protein